MNELRVSYKELYKTRKEIIEDIMTINGIIDQLNSVTAKIKRLKKALTPEKRKDLIKRLEDIKEFLAVYVENTARTLRLTLF